METLQERITQLKTYFSPLNHRFIEKGNESAINFDLELSESKPSFNPETEHNHITYVENGQQAITLLKEMPLNVSSKARIEEWCYTEIGKLGLKSDSPFYILFKGNKIQDGLDLPQRINKIVAGR